jgi:uncharacterized membrane protein YkvA (DUF1232 family)
VNVTRQGEAPDVQHVAGFLGEIIRQIRLVWRLLTDSDVPGWVKFIPPLAILYVISPIDLVPDPMLGLGQLDDLAVLLLGLKVFVEMCPGGVVQRHRDELAGDMPPEAEGEVIDASYRVLDDE